MPSFLPLIIIVTAAVICLVTLINTNFGLILLIFSMLLSPEFPIGAVSGRSIVVRIDDILLIVIFFTWLAKLAMNKELGLLRQASLNKPIVTYIVILFITTALGLLSGHIHSPASSFFYIAKYIEYYMLFFMVSNVLENKKQIRIFVFFILLTALITSVYAISTTAEFGRATAPFEDVAGGTRGEPNTLGGYLLLIFAISTGIMLYANNLFVALPLGILSLIIAYTIIHTLSRGSYLSFIVMFLALTMLTTRKKALLTLIALLSIVLVPHTLPKKVNQRINETFIGERVYEPLRGTKIRLDESASARIESWKSIFDKWKKSPLFGHGVTGVGFTDTQYPLVLGEAGILGLSAFIWLMISILQNSLRIFLERQDAYLRGLSLGFTAGFIGLLIHSFSASTFIIVRIMEPFWFLAAIVMLLPEIEGQARQKQLIQTH